MTVQESDRNALLRAVAQSWGEEVADTLSELLPPSGDRPATQRDIDGVLAAMEAMDARLTAELRAQRESADARFEAIDKRFESMEASMVARFEQVDARFVSMEAQFEAIDARFASVEAQFVSMEARFASVEAQFVSMGAQLQTFGDRAEGFGRSIDEKLESVVDRVTANFERRISEAVTTQTRTLVFSQLGALVVIAALAFGLR